MSNTQITHRIVWADGSVSEMTTAQYRRWYKREITCKYGRSNYVAIETPKGVM